MSKTMRTMVTLLCIGAALLTSSHDVAESRLHAAQAPATKNSSSAKADAQLPMGANAAEKSVYAALDEAIELLEQQRYAQFFIHYLPVDDLRKMRQDTSPFRAAFGMAARQKETKQLIALLRLARRGKPEFRESNMVVTLRFEQGSEESSDPGSEEQPAAEVAGTIDGYGGDLKQVLAAGINALEGGDTAGFVTHIFPLDEVKRMQITNTQNDLVHRIKQNPDMSKQMLADLKALSEVEPKYNDEKSVATWEFGTKGKGKAYRRYSFEKVGGNWRFSGKQAKQARAEIARQRGLKAGGIEIEISLERLGDKWRLYEMPRF